MKVQEIRLEGFRSLKSVAWRPGSLNVLIGPNASGKSNLLRGLELVRTAAVGSLADAVLRMGGMGPIVWDGSAKAIDLCLRTDPVKPGGDLVREALTYSFRLQRVPNSGAFEIPSERLAKYHDYEQGVKPAPFLFLDRHHTRASIFDQQQKLLLEPTETIPPDESALSLVSELWGNTVVSEFQRRLRTWAIYHDLRVDEGAPIRQAVVTRRETRVSTDGQNLVAVLNTLYTSHRDFKREINQAMAAAFPDDFEELNFPPAEDGRVQMRMRRKRGKREHAAADLSDGTIRFLLLLTILATPDPGPLIAIDEPEVGLHPSMLPILAEFAVEASRRSQVILATHSPQMLDAFGDTIPTTTVCTWAGDHTEIKTIEGNDLKKWIEDYSLGRFLYSGEAEAVL